MILLGDFNGDLGNSLGDKDKKKPNDRGLLLLDFANFFNICPVNLLKQCKGPLESFHSHCGKYHSSLDYIFLPNCLLNNIGSPETFDQDVDNTSDHLTLLIQHHCFSQQRLCSCSTNLRQSRSESLHPGIFRFSSPDLGTSLWKLNGVKIALRKSLSPKVKVDKIFALAKNF